MHALIIAMATLGTPQECGFFRTGQPILDVWQALDICELLPEPADCARMFGHIAGATPAQTFVAMQLNECTSLTPACEHLLDIANNTTGPEECAFQQGDFFECIEFGIGLDEITSAAVCGSLL